MVETRGSRRKSLAPAAAADQQPPKAATQPEPATTSNGSADGSAEATIAKYRQRFQQQRQAEQRTAWRRLVSWLRLRYHQYEISYAPYMLEPWEKVLVLGFILSVVGLTLYGLRNVALRFLSQ